MKADDQRKLNRAIRIGLQSMKMGSDIWGQGFILFKQLNSYT